MKKFAVTAVFAWSLVASLPSIGLADQGEAQRVEPKRQQLVQAKHMQKPQWKRWEHVRGPVAPSVPELDPSVGGMAILLLAAATCLLLERRRART